MAHAVQDVETMPTLREVLAPYFAYWGAVRETLLVGWPRDRERGRRVRATIEHALDFRTWRSLAREQGLEDGDVVELMVALVAAAASADGGR